MRPGLLCILSFLVPVTAAQNECSTGWKYYSDSCYIIPIESTSWPEAQEICDIIKSTIVEVGSAEEKNFIEDLLKSNQVSGGVWLGGTDIFEDGNWIWVSTNEKIFPFTNWHPGQPDNIEGASCLALGTLDNYTWFDTPCSESYRFICELRGEEVIVG